jgi:hypothetical protein
MCVYRLTWCPAWLLLRLLLLLPPVQLKEVVLEAVVSCSHKTLHYALLLGEQTVHTVAGTETHPVLRHQSAASAVPTDGTFVLYSSVCTRLMLS